MVNGFNIYGFIHNTNLDKKITTLAKKKKKLVEINIDNWFKNG